MNKGTTDSRRYAVPRSRLCVYALIPLLALAGSAELVLRVINYRTSAVDPYESFVLRTPLFEAEGSGLRTRVTRRLYFHDQHFQHRKKTGTVRFFAIGGSTTHGYPHRNAATVNYASALARQLHFRRPDLDFEAINCGGCSYASYRLLHVLEECLEYSPDFLIVMTGHNEFLEPRIYGDLRGRKELPFWYHLRLSHLICDARERAGSGWARRRGVADRSDLILAHEQIRQDYLLRDEEEIEATRRHFAWNVKRMVSLCREREIPLVLCTVASNLRDWPPFATQPAPGISPDEVEQKFSELRQMLQEKRFEPALTRARTMIRSHPRTAGAHFIAGKCLDALGYTHQAAHHYRQARDTDAFPHRGLSSFNETIREIAEEQGVPLFDTSELFQSLAKDGVPGSDLFVDNCHPTIEAHARIADKLEELIVEKGWLPPAVTAQSNHEQHVSGNRNHDKLQEDDKLQVSDPLDKFFPDYPRGDEVTLRHLLTHTSGIHSYTSKPEFPLQVTQFVEVQLWRAPGGLHHLPRRQQALRPVVRATENGNPPQVRDRVFLARCHC